jgi:hypothetical protein
MTIAVTLPMMRINYLLNAHLECYLYTIPIGKSYLNFSILPGSSLRKLLYTSDRDALMH